MKKSLLLAALCLGGCATFGDLDKGLASLVGQPAARAIDALGYPSAEQKFGGDTVYVWTASRSGALVMPTTNTTSGYVGSTPFYGSTTGTQVIPMNGQCSIKIGVGPDGLITRYDWEGNRIGCEGFMKRMKPYAR